jgi:hypothetical protein
MKWETTESLEIVVDDGDNGPIGKQGSEPEGIIVEIDNQIFLHQTWNACTGNGFPQITLGKIGVELMQPRHKTKLMMQ